MIEYNNSFVEKNTEAKEKIIKAKEVLLSRKAPGNEFLGWIDLPVNYDKSEFERILNASEKIKKDSDILIVIGIGGSYLGAKAADAFLNNNFGIGKGVKGSPQVYYAGNNLSSFYTNELIEAIGDRDFSINVISKSGTTTEPAVAFRIFKSLLEKKYGKDEAKKRIYATTDKSKGALKTLADNEGYETFVVPDDIGGRFSVLTAVGLLPIAVSGADIQKLMDGARDMRERCLNSEFCENEALKYAATRFGLYQSGKKVEILANYEPNFHYIAEWWKQLYGESEGKDGKGLFPASVDLTTDLHSMGQYIQDGERILIETVLVLDDAGKEIKMIHDDENLDGLNYLEGKNLDFVNDCAMKGTLKAHLAGGVPVSQIHIAKKDEYNLGELFYFFEFACGVSGYALEVNPFNQPGVEEYKKNMFTLLGKPGYEKTENM